MRPSNCCAAASAYRGGLKLRPPGTTRLTNGKTAGRDQWPGQFLRGDRARVRRLLAQLIWHQAPDITAVLGWLELTRFRGHLVTADLVRPQALLQCALPLGTFEPIPGAEQGEVEIGRVGLGEDLRQDAWATPAG